MSDRMEKTREALGRLTDANFNADRQLSVAALAEVEEWETRLADTKEAFRLLAVEQEHDEARAEAAEAERDELKRLCEKADEDFHRAHDARFAAEAERDRLLAALKEIADPTKHPAHLRGTAELAVWMNANASAALGKQT